MGMDGVEGLHPFPCSATVVISLTTTQQISIHQPK